MSLRIKYKYYIKINIYKNKLIKLNVGYIFIYHHSKQRKKSQNYFD